MVSHGHITVNGTKTTIPSRAIRIGDRIGVRAGSKDAALFATFAEKFMERPLPSWLTWNPKAMEGGVQTLPTAEAADPAGDLVAEVFAFGYLTTGILFGAIIAAIAAAYYFLRMDAILAFWLAYIFTRPLGASFGDLLSQPLEYGGLGLGTIVTSAIFLVCIAALVAYMTITGSTEDQALVAE